MTRDEVVELLKKISETGGDTPDMMEDLKRLQDEFDEREGELRRIDEERQNETRYSDSDVFAEDGVRWSEKYDDMRRQYRDRFFSGPEIVDNQAEDIRLDDESNNLTFDELFEDREGDYQEV